MTISVSEAGKRYNRDWIFRNFSFTFRQGGTYAITGPNGSGKSTLLQVVAGAVTASEGSVQYEMEGHRVEDSRAFRNLSLAAPYLELVEEMTLLEFLSFHQQFKPMLPEMQFREIIALCKLEKASNRQIRYFSSGMKQRVKLAQAIFSATTCVLLDEPCTNLDTEGISLYLHLIDKFCSGRLVIVSSNDKQEYQFCQETINILDYKPVSTNRVKR